MTTLDTEFETRNEAEEWLRSCYIFLQEPVPSIMENEAFFGADEFVACDYVRSIIDGNQRPVFAGLMIGSAMQTSLDPYSDRWSKKVAINGNLVGRTDYYTAINMCNHFISKVDQVYNWDDAEKRERKGEVMALKAYYYFELVRRYGPIILVPENIDPNVDVQSMKVPRSHVDTCFNYIVSLCDEVVEVTFPVGEEGSQSAGLFRQRGGLGTESPCVGVSSFRFV